MLKLVKMKHPLAREAFDSLGEALTKFGTYDYNDKGPDEVMDVDGLVRKFRDAGAAEALAAMKDMVPDVFGKTLVSALLVNLQEWDDLFDLDEDFTGKYL